MSCIRRYCRCSGHQLHALGEKDPTKEEVEPAVLHTAVSYEHFNLHNSQMNFAQFDCLLLSLAAIHCMALPTSIGLAPVWTNLVVKKLLSKNSTFRHKAMALICRTKILIAACPDHDSYNPVNCHFQLSQQSQCDCESRQISVGRDSIGRACFGVKPLRGERLDGKHRGN